jgi:hypothetical protein
MSWTKLFNTIVTSSIWQADDATRLVWITMLATKNANGIVEASIIGLAYIARVSLENCQRAIKVLESPDPYSRTAEHEGRRIEKVSGGWKILNHELYREKGRSVERREYLRQKQAEHRARIKQECQPMSTNVNRDKPISDTDTDTDINTTIPPISPQGDEGGKLPNSGNQKISEAVQQIFDYWNSYAGRSVEKPSGQGGVKRIVWKGHRTLAKDKIQAIKAGLTGFSAADLIGAIDNYAAVLLGGQYFWSYAWALGEFFTRGRERHKQAERQFWQFLPDNFDAERYLRQGSADEVHVRDLTPEEDYQDSLAHPNPPMTAEQVNSERIKIGWPALSEAELAELPHTPDGLILVTADVREKWSAEYLERRKAIAS